MEGGGRSPCRPMPCVHVTPAVAAHQCVLLLLIAHCTGFRRFSVPGILHGLATQVQRLVGNAQGAGRQQGQQ